MNLENVNSIVSRSIIRITLLGFLTFLAGCSEGQPDGQIYFTNGLGITLPAAGVEVDFIPGPHGRTSSTNLSAKPTPT